MGEKLNRHCHEATEKNYCHHGRSNRIGRAIITELVGQNTVVSIDRSPAKIAVLKAAFPAINSLQADVTDQQQVQQVLDEIGHSYGRIDVLINNAGVGKRLDFTTMTETELADLLEQEVNTNYKAPILLTKKALPLLRQSSEPVVVFVSSGLAHMPIADLASYCATKSAMHFFAMSLRHQLGALSIKVVEVLPPTVDTDFNKGVNAPKMAANTFARHFLNQLEQGKTVINIGQSKALSFVSRFLPGLAFAMLNRPSH